MKKIFNAISAVVLSSMILCACHGSKSLTTSECVYGYSVNVTKVVMSKPDTLTDAQIDSVVRVDRLPQMSKWATSAFKDDETGAGYTYRILYDKTTKTTYTVKVLGTGKYVLSKKSLEIR